jgi:hypothetical protein
MMSPEKLAWARATSLMPLRKPLAIWSIRFTFGVPIVVLVLDALGKTPSADVLTFLESIIRMTTVPIIGYLVTSMGETIAKILKGTKIGESVGGGDCDGNDDGQDNER